MAWLICSERNGKEWGGAAVALGGTGRHAPWIASQEQVSKGVCVLLTRQ